MLEIIKPYGAPLPVTVSAMHMLVYNSTYGHPNEFVSLHRKMLTKDKKPTDEKVKETGEVITERPETPKLYKAALELAKGQTFAKLKESYKGATLEVFTPSV
jgi:hypothetical protein